MMSRMIKALSVSAVLLLALIVIVVLRREEEPAGKQPRGSPPDLSLQHRLAPRELAPPVDDAPEREAEKPASTSDKEEPKPPIEYRPQTQPSPRGLVAPGERPLRRERFSAEVLVLHNGESVEKAHVAVRYVQRGPHGGRTDPLAFEAA